MSKIMNDNFKINVGNPIDSRYLASTNLPYVSVSAVNSAIVQSQRYVGLTVNINNVEYWYETGVLDGSLIIKDSGLASTGVTAAYNGITKEGNAVKLGGTLTGATIFTKSGTGSLLKYAGDYSGEFDAQTIPDAEFVTGLTSQSITSSSNGLTKVDQDVKLGGTTPLDETTNICGGSQVLNLGTAASKLGAFTVNAASAAIISDGTADICPTGILTVDGSAIAVKAVASYDDDKSSSYTLRSLPDVAYVTGLTSAIGASSITGATNGITKTGQDVELGGDLTKSTTIDGCNNMVTINNLGDYSEISSTNSGYICFGSGYPTIGTTNGCVSMLVGNGNNLEINLEQGVTQGATYSEDYSGNYINRSLVDKEYVDTEINNLTGVTSQAITSANNGLTKIDQNVILGGELTGSTCIYGNDTNFTIERKNTTGTVVRSSLCLNLDAALSGTDKVDLLVGTDSYLCLGSSGNYAYLGSNSAGSETKIATSQNTLLLSASGAAEYCDNNSNPINYVGDYSANYTLRSLVDAHYVTGLTTTSGVQTASNGLTKTGTNVVLGGALATDTQINLNNGNCLEITDVGNNASYIFDQTNITLNNNDSIFEISNSGDDYTLTHCSGSNVDLSLSGLTYGGDYSSNFKENTLVTKSYVDSATGGIDANNGLSRSGDNIVLGGDLTGTTTISSASHDNCLLITAPMCACDVHILGFDTTPSVGWVEGQLYYDNCQLNFDREVSGVTLQIGEEQVIRAENQTGNAIPNGTIVYVNGASAGGFPTIDLADTSGFVSATQTIGVTTQEILNNNEGYVTSLGTIHDVDTNGFAAGTLLWLSTGGTYTDVRPSYPNYTVSIGIVTKAGVGDGEIYVRLLYVPNYTEYGLFTGYTASTLTTLAEKLDIIDFNTYTGDTETRIAANEAITAVAITGVTNGLCGYSTHNACLGGTLSSDVTLSGAQTLTLGDLNGICMSVANTNDIGINAKSNGAIYMKSQSGVVASSSDMTDAVGISIDYNASIPMLVTDNRPTPRGLQYADDYTSTYLDRSLVDKYYVDSIATGLNVHAAVFAATTAGDGNIVLSGNTGTIDNVDITDIISINNRILVKNQTDAQYNGIYSASTGDWGRTEDYNFAPSGEISNGDLIPVVSGLTNANSQWINVSVNPIVSGDSLNFSVFSQQQGIIEGDGTCVTTVGSNRQVSVKLSPSASGLCFDATALELDYDTFRYGLTCSNTTGKVDVRACLSTAVGDEILVRLDTGGTNTLYVDKGDFSYTTASNGLHKDGCNVVLGGALTGNTIVSGDDNTYDLSFTGLNDFNLGFNGSGTITDINGSPAGLIYASDYSSTFVDESLVTKYFVNNAITGDTLTFNQGLTKTDDVIKWGGTLSEDRALLYGGVNFCVKSTGIDFLMNCSCVLTTNTNIDLRSCNNGSGCDSSIGLTDTGAISIVSNASTGLTITSAGVGAVYAGDYSANYIARSLVDAAYVTGQTAISGIQTASNGLTKIGTNVVLGGTLTGDTYIEYGTDDFVVRKDSNWLDYFQLKEGLVDIYNEDGDGSYREILSTGTYITLDSANGLTGAESTLVLNQTNIDLTSDNGSGATTNINLNTTIDLTGAVTLQSTPATGSASDALIVWNSTDKIIKQIDSTSFGIQTASNGLTKTGTDVALGGILSETTTISGGSQSIIFGTSTSLIGFNICGSFSTVGDSVTAISDRGQFDMGTCCVALTSCFDATNYTKICLDQQSIEIGIGSATSGALEYSDDYHSKYNLRTLPDVAYVTGLTSAIETEVAEAITGATNGLTKSGQDAKLGGILSENTTICGGTFDMYLGTGGSPFNYLYTNAQAGIYSQVGSVDYTCINMDCCHIDLCAYDGGIGSASICIESNDGIAIGTSGATYAMYYDDDYSSKYTPRTIPDVAWVTGQTSSSGVQTASNGLTKTGTNVVLGGTLTSNTDIIVDTSTLNIKDTGTASLSVKTNCICAQTSSEVFVNVDCASVTLFADKVGTGTDKAQICIDGEAAYGNIYLEASGGMYFDAGGIMEIRSTTGVGLQYFTAYKENFVCHSLVDVDYVTGLTSTSGVQTAVNGLTKTGTEVKLGGALTGDTTISGAHTLALSSLTAFNATATNIGLTGVVDITGAVNITGAIDGNSTLDILGATELRSTLDVTGATQIGGTLGVTGALTTTTTAQIGGNLTLDTVGAGDVGTDDVMMIDSSGVVKKVAASTLGEDNNIYDMTVITTNTTLTTGSTYVQLVNSPASILTVTLPASPINGQVFRIKDAAGAALNYNITIARNGKLIDNATTDGVLNTDGGALEIVYNSALGSWFVFSFVN